MLLVALGALLVVVRLTGPSDLLDNDQLRPAAYANDVLVNAHWIVQTDTSGDIASKPPLTTWLISLISLGQGRATILTLAIPSAFAVLGCAVLSLGFGWRRFEPIAGIAAALTILLSPMGAKQVTLIRTDAMYGFVVGAATLLAWRAWRRGSGWVPFWLAAACVMLTKGPVGLIVPAGAMLGALWGRRARGVDRPARSGRALLVRHGIGLAVFLLIAGGWFVLAWMSAGDAFVEKLLGRELLGQAAHSAKGDLPFTGFYNPPLYYLSRFAPGSVFTFIGLWRVWKHPAPDAESRALERFLFCGFVAGMLVFCAAPHQRADHLTPLWVPGALLAGREIARLAHAVTQRVRLGALGLWIGAGLGAAFVYYHTLAAGGTLALRAQGLRELADKIEALPTRLPLLHVDDNSALQFYLGTMDRRVSPEAAADALAHDEPILVAASARVGDLDELLAARGISATLIASWTGEDGWGVRVLANEAASEALSR